MIKSFAVLAVLAMSCAAPALGQTPAAPDFPGCEWRPAQEKGPPGRSALFCKGAHGGWRRINNADLTPETAAKAKAGDIHAMAVLGDVYTFALRRNHRAEGDALVEKAAAAGDPLALFDMGMMRDVSGSTVLPEGATAAQAEAAQRKAGEDREKGFDYFRRAGAKGYVPAMRVLAIAMYTSDTVAEGMTWRRRAAEAGDAEAMVDLHYKLTNREGTTGDPAEAARWIRRAAETGNVKAMHVFASDLESGAYGVQKDAALSKTWRAKANAADLEQMLDQAKRDGLDLEPSTFGRRQGVGSAIGEFYFNGRDGVTQDVAEATRWYLTAAEHGDEEAAYRLETIYRKGAPDVPVDEAAAARWEARNKALRFEDLVAGAEDGLVEQMKELAILYLTGDDNNGYLTAPKNPAEGLRWLKAAQKADPKDSEVTVMLAAANRAGLGGKADAAEAKRLEAQAAAQDPVRFGSLDALIAHADTQPTAALVVLAQRLFEAGRRDEGVFWYYVFQLRGRMEASTDETTAQAYGALFATLGPMFNEYAAGDLTKLEATIDKVLAWDAAHPMKGVAKDVRDKQRGGLADLKAYFITNKDKVRAERTKNGLPNTP